MKNPRLREIITDSLLDGFTGAGLFGRLRLPGAPDVLIDTRSVADWVASGEFADNCTRFSEAYAEFCADRNAPRSEPTVDKEHAHGSRVSR